MANNKKVRNTNFGIDNYIHLSSTGALDDKNAVGDFGLQPQDLIMRTYRRMEAKFKRITGIGSEEFMEKVTDDLQTFLHLGAFFNSKTLAELIEYGDINEMIQSYPSVLQRASVSEARNAITNYYAGAKDKNASDVAEFIESNMSRDVYGTLSDAFTSKMGDSEGREKLLLSQALINNIKSSSRNQEIILELKNLKEIDELLNKVISSLSGAGRLKKALTSRGRRKDIEKINRLMSKGIIDDLEKHANNTRSQQFSEEIITEMVTEHIAKSGNIARFSGGVDTSQSRATKTIQKEKESRRQGTGDMSKLTTSITGSGRVVDVVSGMIEDLQQASFGFTFHVDDDGMTRNKGAQSSKRVLSTKTVGDLDTIFDKSNFTILEIINLLNIYDGSGSSYFTGGKASAFLNAMNLFILGRGYTNDDYGNPKPEMGRSFSSQSSVDASFNNVLGSFLGEAFVALLNPVNVMFIRLGDTIVPTPIVVKAIMQLQARERGSGLMKFDSIGESRSRAAGIVGASRAGVYSSTKVIERHHISTVATYRNWDMQQLFLSQNVSVNKQVLNSEDVRRIIYK